MNELKGWPRTMVLAFGGSLGVIATATVIHLAKGGKGSGRLAKP